MIFYRGYVVKFEDYGRVRVYDPLRPYQTVTYESSFQNAKTYIDFLYFLQDKVAKENSYEEQ